MSAGRTLALSLLSPILVFATMQRSFADDAVERRVQAIVKKMTLEEKLDYIGGTGGFSIRAIPRLGLPELRMADGPLGVRNAGPSTAYAAGIALAASWDVELANRVGGMIGRDARTRGVHFLLGPGVNICRTPLGGRNFEYFGEDPILAARMAVAYIQGVQEQGVSATVKHFVGNNSELNRHHTSSEIDERTLRELYLPAFEAAVREAKVGAIMAAYNMVGGVHMTEHDALNNRIAKREWGFDGVLMSDWDATYNGVAAANSGLDLEMPSGKQMNRAHLLPALQDGIVPEAGINDKVMRILRTAIRFGWLDHAQSDPSWPLYSEQGRALALESARAGMVLLKNQGLLPLDKNKVKSVAVIGPGAHPAVPTGGGSAQVNPFVAVSYLEGLSSYLGGKVRYSRGVVSLDEVFDSTLFVTANADDKPGLLGEYFANGSLEGAPAVTRTDEHVHFTWDAKNPWPAGNARSFSARWSGFFIPLSSGDYRFSVSSYGLDGYRLFVDGIKVLDRTGAPQPILDAVLKLKAGDAHAVRLEYLHFDHHARLGFGVRKTSDFVTADAKSAVAGADVAVVFVGFDPSNEGEGADRTFELPPGQDELIAQVRSANKHTIVVLTSGGGVDMSRFVDAVPAIVQAWYAGQKGGTALAQLLFGDFSPSAKLPVTFERRLADGAAAANYLPGSDGKVHYREGLLLGYRHVDGSGSKPLFPFGYGLSYTKFAYGNLAVSPAPAVDDGMVSVAFDVTNTGKREGAEVAQVYVSDGHAPVPRPAKELKAFAKVRLAAGETKRVELALDRRAFAYFDDEKSWTVAPGSFEILVGSSSQQIELRGKVTLK
jgi:beta-glucosidase